MEWFWLIVVALFVWLIVVGIKRSKKAKANLETLKQDFSVDKLYDTTSPMVVIDNTRKELAFVCVNSVKRVAIADVMNWQHKWVEKSRNGYLSTSNHTLDITIRSMETPLIKVSCPNKAVGENLNATLNVVVNGS